VGRAKQAEIEKEQPLEAVLLELICEVAEIWSRLSIAIISVNICDVDEWKRSNLYIDRAFWMPDHDRCLAMKFARIVEQFESRVIGAGIRRIAHLAHASARKQFGSRGRRSLDIPSAAEIRRLRIVTEQLPNLVCATSKRGIGKNRHRQWQMLWRFGLGIPATAIANGLRGQHENGQRRRAENRSTIYRRRDEALSDIASFLIPHLKRISAA
jgi:hypothetical protein